MFAAAASVASVLGASRAPAAPDRPAATPPAHGGAVPLASASFTVPPGLPAILLSAGWEQATTGEVRLRVIKPDGTRVEEEAILDEPSPGAPPPAANSVVRIDSETTSHGRTLGVFNPGAGDWGIEVVSARDALGKILLAALPLGGAKTPSAAPRVEWIAPL